MKKYAYLLMAAAAILLASCKNENTPNISVTSITLKDKELTVEKGTRAILESTIAPIDASNKGVTWASSYSGVAIVEGGLITAVGVGTATITVTTKDGGYTDVCEITVIINASGIKLNQSTLALNVDETATLSATVLPNDASNQGVTWESSDSTVAAVSDNGLVTAMGPGKAVVTATAMDGSKRAASCVVTVTAPVTGITLDNSTLTIIPGGTATLTATIAPADASNQAVTWSSDTPAVATVDAAGLVAAVAAGTANITVKTTDGGYTAVCVVTVSTIAVTGVTLSDHAIALEVAGTKTLTATVAPANATNKAITWSSDTPGVATVSSAGLVTAVAAGTANITVTTADGAKTDVCVVTVNASAITLGPNLLQNASFEDNAVSGNTDLLQGQASFAVYVPDEAAAASPTAAIPYWLTVPWSWYQTFFAANPTIFPETLAVGRFTDALRGTKNANFFANAGNFFNPYIVGTYAMRLGAPSQGAGTYQIVDGVTPGSTYQFSVQVGLRKSFNFHVFRDGYPMVKILSADGTTMYGSGALVMPTIPTDISTLPKYSTANNVAPFTPVNDPDGLFINDFGTSGDNPPYLCFETIIKGTVTIPAGVTKIRFQVDYPATNAAAPNQGSGDAPAQAIDDCRFQQVQ